MMKIHIKNLKNVPLPIYGTEDSAGMDLTAAIDTPIVLGSGKRVLVPTGIAIALPKGYEAQIRPRSGLALKNGITLVNSPGTIDADYRGEISIILINHGEEEFSIEPGMRIAQMVIASYQRIIWDEVDNLDITDRGNGGFGSTGC
jgi:dUTP pyrophosphatase